MNTDNKNDSLPSDSFSHPKINTRASRYRLEEGNGEVVVGTSLDVVIVGSNSRVSKTWHRNPDSETNGKRPNCFSDDGITPDLSIKRPGHAQCEGCHNNIVNGKSLPKGSNETFCRDQHYLAVLPMADPSKVYNLPVTGPSMNAMNAYLKHLRGKGIHHHHVITELGFDDQYVGDYRFPAMTFRQKDFVSDAAIRVVEIIYVSDEVQIAMHQKLCDSKPEKKADAVVVVESRPLSKSSATTMSVEEMASPAVALSLMESKLRELFSERG